ncbi:MAG: LysR family transcriptional regulator [Pseudomonadota bacterium]
MTEPAHPVLPAPSTPSGNPLTLTSLHHLRAFSSVAATGGIRRSAEVLYRASSAVARSVSMLEQRLDVRLFERKGWPACQRLHESSAAQSPARPSPH